MATANDTFVEASDTELSLHTSDSGHTWTDRDGGADLTINAATDVLYANTTAAVNGYHISAVPASADYSVQATFKVPSTNNTTPLITGRNATGAKTMYGANLASSIWYLRKWVAGTHTLMGQYSGDNPLTAKVGRLEMTGDQISVYVDEVLRIGLITDTGITDAGRGGAASLYSDNAATRYIDDWSTIEGATGFIPFPLSERRGARGGLDILRGGLQ